LALARITTLLPLLNFTITSPGTYSLSGMFGAANPASAEQHAIMPVMMDFLFMLCLIS
jgi:hypothetical protein